MLDAIALGSGSPGTFAVARDVPSGRVPWAVTASDLNEDGLLELVVGNVGENGVSVLLG